MIRRAFYLLLMPSLLVQAGSLLADDFSQQVEEAVALGKTGEHHKAALQCQRLALQNSAHVNAERAHLSAIVFAGMALRGAPEQARGQLETLYGNLLEEHIMHWPKGDTAEKVAWWLARHEMDLGGYRAVAEAIVRVPASSSYFGEAVDLALHQFDRALASEQPTEQRLELLQTARDVLQPVVTGAENRWPEHWSPEQVRVAERLAQWHLVYHPEGVRYARRLLSAAGEDTLSRRGKLLFVAARLLDGEDVTAEGLLPEGEPGAGQEGPMIQDALLYIEVLRYEQIENRDRARRVAREVAQWAGPMLIHPLAPETAAALARRQAEAMELSGAALEETLRACDRWIELAPDDPEGFEARARLLASSGDKGRQEESLRAWRVVEDRSKPGGERWVRARRRRLETLRRLGREAEAEKLVTLTRLLYPEVRLEAEPAPPKTRR